MSETVNIAEISNRLSADIFKTFKWRLHPLHDTNFDCQNEKHVGTDEKPKKTHPCDAVFHYQDPYSGKTIFLHTDLKCYKKKTLKEGKLREALRSMCLAVECAQESEDWRTKFSVDTSEQHEIRGLLFVHCHDAQNPGLFAQAFAGINTGALPIAAGTTICFLAPPDILRLLSIAQDIKVLLGEKRISEKHTFFYPDLITVRRQGDRWSQPATIESMTGPFMILESQQSENISGKKVIYYNRPGSSALEFEYFLDSLSRYQLLESDEEIMIRIASSRADENFKNNFEQAKNRYAKAWGFEPSRSAILEKIELTQIPTFASTYTPGWMGWRS